VRICGQHVRITVESHLAHQQTASDWCGSRRKRVLDIILATLALTVTAPLMLLIALGIRATSPGPVLFRQWRLGLNGQQFQLLKFRTMQDLGAESGPGVTRRGDLRVTELGQWLRGCKVDELPQFFNVLRGEMSIVGPRPDLEQFWRQTTEVERMALAAKPGITGAATLTFSNEEELLAHIPESDLMEFYVRDLLPRKARLDYQYAAHASFWSDCRILVKTIVRLFSPSPIHNSPEKIRDNVSR
jgi:lipopolysaccharide/colanic/teichoic acid biosynthesis glycosyltransferase